MSATQSTVTIAALITNQLPALTNALGHARHAERLHRTTRSAFATDVVSEDGLMLIVHLLAETIAQILRVERALTSLD